MSLMRSGLLIHVQLIKIIHKFISELSDESERR